MLIRRPTNDATAKIISRLRAKWQIDNDPSAGSPTDTLLRLLLPLNAKAHGNSPPKRQILTIRRNIQSVEATGGVYKEQGRNQRSLMNRAY